MTFPLSAPPINGVVESVLYTDDLDRSARFYGEVLGLPVIAGDDDRFKAFNAGPASVLLVFRRGGTLEPTPIQGGVIPPHDGHGPHHIGFAIAADSYAAWKNHLVSHGIAIKSETTWPRGGQSVFFRDPDGHLVELATPGIWTTY